MLPLLRCIFAHLLILQYPDHHQNLISSSLCYSGPVHKISSQSVHNFLSNVVHRQTNRQTDKQTNQRYQKHNLLCQGGNDGISIAPSPKKGMNLIRQQSGCSAFVWIIELNFFPGKVVPWYDKLDIVELLGEHLFKILVPWKSVYQGSKYFFFGTCPLGKGLQKSTCPNLILIARLGQVP